MLAIFRVPSRLPLRFVRIIATCETAQVSGYPAQRRSGLRFCAPEQLSLTAPAISTEDSLSVGHGKRATNGAA